MSDRIPATVLAAFRSSPWAISPAGLARTMAVISRLPVPPEALHHALNPTALPARAGVELDNTRAVTIRDGVATIPVQGTLTRYASWFSRISGGTSYGSIATDLQTALDTPSVRAILFQFDTPGGEVNGCSDLAAQIYAARGTKPILAFAGGELCSAGYWLASACDEIVGSRSVLAGCLGVRMSWVDTRAADEALGYVEHEWVSSETPKKALDPAIDVDRARVQALVDALADVMLTDIGAYRDVPRADVAERYGAGEVFVGQSALALGLLDRLDSYEAVHAELAAAGRPSAYVPRWFARRAGASAPSAPTSETAMPTPAAATTPTPPAGSGTTPTPAAGAPTPTAPAAATTPTAPAAGAPNANASAADPASIDAQLAAAREIGRTAGHAAGLEEGRTLGANAEHTRLMGILGYAAKGSAETIRACLADRACSPEAAAAKILGAETSAGSHYLAQLGREEQTLDGLGGAPKPNATGTPSNGSPKAEAKALAAQILGAGRTPLAGAAK